jgi:NADH-quinone oxidoreductase subunit C
LLERLLAVFPGAEVTLVNNPGPAAQHSLLLGARHAVAIARFLRDDAALRLDYCSNVTGVDWPDREVVETVKKTVPVAPSATGGPGPGLDSPSPAPPAAPATKVVEEKVKRIIPGCLEVVYHLYSMALKQGPVIIRQRTANRADQVTVASLTPVWRACEFQEREAFDLYGIVFDGHPDLRRILMWDEFKDHPMRKDYVEPDDYEWEPTAHGEVLEKTKQHAAREVTNDE